MPAIKGTKANRAEKKQKTKKDDPEDPGDNYDVGRSRGQPQPAEKAKHGDDSDFCVDCGHEVLASQQGLKCDSCGFWHHASCEKVQDDVYSFLSSHNDEPSILWYCKKCVIVSKRMNATMMSLHDHQMQLEEKLNEMTSAVN